jgi:hypothetical protein
MPCYARLGETEEQCVQRYGSPDPGFTEKGRAKQEAFTVDGFSIIVTFLDKISVSEIYTKVDKSDFTREEVDIIVQKNADAKGWGNATNVSEENSVLWEGDNQRCAVWNNGDTVSVDSIGSGLASDILSSGAAQQATSKL